MLCICFSDPTSLKSVTSKGKDEKRIFSRHCGCRTLVMAHIFEAIYSDQSPVEIRVDSAIDQSTAKGAAQRYAAILGRIPAAWRNRIAIFTISPGNHYS